MRSQQRRDNALLAVVVQTCVHNVLKWLRMARNVPWPRYGKARPTPQRWRRARSVDAKESPATRAGPDQNFRTAFKIISTKIIGDAAIKTAHHMQPRRLIRTTYTYHQGHPCKGAPARRSRRQARTSNNRYMADRRNNGPDHVRMCVRMSHTSTSHY